MLSYRWHDALQYKWKLRESEMEESGLEQDRFGREGALNEYFGTLMVVSVMAALKFGEIRIKLDIVRSQCSYSIIPFFLVMWMHLYRDVYSDYTIARAYDMAGFSVHTIQRSRRPDPPVLGGCPLPPSVVQGLCFSQI